MLPAYDTVYFLYSIPALILSIISTILLSYWQKKYQQVDIKKRITGMEVINKIVENENLKLHINIIPTILNESWDGDSKTLNISQTAAYGRTVTGTAIIAHELGHALQDRNNDFLYRIRRSIVPVVNFGSNLGYVLMIIGFALSLTDVAWIGLIFFASTTLFVLITLPIEIDASRKALKMLTKHNIIYDYEKANVSKVLTGAALTYVAALFQSLGELAYFLFKIKAIDRED